MDTLAYSLSAIHIKDIKQKMLHWAQNRFSIFSFLDNNEYPTYAHQYECMLAIAGDTLIQISSTKPFSQLKEFHLKHPGWLFGHIQYPSSKHDDMGFPQTCFFKPEILITLQAEILTIECINRSATEILQEITQQTTPKVSLPDSKDLWKASLSKDQYLENIRRILQHIQRGDCYELNYCIEYRAQKNIPDPVHVYKKLTEVSPNPFAAYYRIGDAYAFCASPERFLMRKDSTLFSEPIKGTAKRNLHDQAEDAKIKKSLQSDPKERSENVMTVDLVRNDMSKIAEEDSVAVNELYGIYTFPQVHHMISRVTASVQMNTHWTDILDACFPMGSMTGAPKKRVMELIAQYETTPRQLFSGTIGYVDPSGNFDFNVVIRSIFYHQTSKTIICKVGSGITVNSDPEREYEECISKIEALQKIL